MDRKRCLARKNLEKAGIIFQKLNDAYFLGQTYRDQGYLCFLQDDFDQAEQLYQQSMELSRSVDDPYGLAQAEVQLGEIALQNNKPELALQQFNRALEACLEIGDLYLEGDLYFHLATAFVQLKDFSQAQNMARRAEEVIWEVGSPAQMKDLYSVYPQIYQGLGQPEAALEAFQKYHVIRDSLFTVEKTTQLEELQLIYAVEKKNQAIQLLSKDVELHLVKQQGLIGGLIALTLIAGLVIYLQYIRRQQERKTAEEARRLRTLELEKSRLEKQQLERELTAQVLQLCRKNEMLISVQEETKGLAKQPSENHQPSLRRLQRSIQSDIQSDDDWRQFLSTFEHVHPLFLTSLTENYIFALYLLDFPF